MVGDLLLIFCIYFFISLILSFFSFFLFLFNIPPPSSSYVPSRNGDEHAAPLLAKDIAPAHSRVQHAYYDDDDAGPQ